MDARVQRQAVQHIDDIEIPVIEITEGWDAEKVTTRQECNDAFSYLMSACAQIEFQIDVELTKPKSHQDDLWIARAKCALKYKKAALQIVQQRRSTISTAEERAWKERRDGRLLEYIRGIVPDHQFLEWVRASDIGSSEPPAAT